LGHKSSLFATADKFFAIIVNYRCNGAVLLALQVFSKDTSMGGLFCVCGFFFAEDRMSSSSPSFIRTAPPKVMLEQAVGR